MNPYILAYAPVAVPIALAVGVAAWLVWTDIADYWW